ncbi:hypothetical protein ACQ86D_38105 [Streptomyces galilaeus]
MRRTKRVRFLEWRRRRNELRRRGSTVPVWTDGPAGGLFVFAGGRRTD